MRSLRSFAAKNSAKTMTAKNRPNGKTIAVALSWDGARCPIRSLSAKARAFLGSSAAPSAQKMAALFQEDQVKELRICWVPRLKGGNDVLSVAFPMQTRLGFKSAKVIALGDMLGVVYKR